MPVSKKIFKRLIVALDLEDKRKIRRIISSLKGYVEKFKIGPIAYTKFGPSLIKELKDKGLDVFLDLKLLDIPNTMVKTSFILAKLGVWAFTVHLKAGEESLKILKEELRDFSQKNKLKKPWILGVTELTSQKASFKKVLSLSSLAAKVGIEGVICSGKEAPFIRERYPHLKIITPGIGVGRSDDQKRVVSASFALKYADFIVAGRPIIQEKDYLEAAKKLLSS